MSTLDASIMTDSDERTHHSESEMITIGDLVMWHQMPFLSVRRLTQLNCPRWSMWDSSNIARISKARTLDETRDWYFPIIVKQEKIATEKAHPPIRTGSDKRVGAFSSLLVKDVWSSWSGIWHSSAQHASERASPLPPMTHLPPEWLHFSIPRDDIMASAGGLLLIKSDVVPIRRSKRLNPALADLNPSSISDTTKLSNGWIGNRTPQSWQRLLVCNPLTRECRELPAANCRWLGWSSWKVIYRNGVQACLVVNEDANCYQVILTFSNFVAVYTSPTNSWNCLQFSQERPWGRRIPSRYIVVYVRWGYICASAHVGGRLYFADVQCTTAAAPSLEPSLKAINAATLRLFEVVKEAGTWQLVQEYTLRKFHIPSLKFPVKEFFYDMSIIPYLEILECLGGLYAVLPAKIHDAWLIREEEEEFLNRTSKTLFGVDEFGRKFIFMPLCFHIIQLQGHSSGVLRIQVPLSETVYKSRILRLMSIARQEHFFFRNWFSCEARGSVIWVTCEDYLLSFDVVSGKSQTWIIPLDDGTNHQFTEETLRFAYRPSLHMKP